MQSTVAFLVVNVGRIYKGREEENKECRATELEVQELRARALL
jgi:hypothetical protein